MTDKPLTVDESASQADVKRAHVRWWANAYDKEGGHGVVVQMLREFEEQLAAQASTGSAGYGSVAVRDGEIADEAALTSAIATFNDVLGDIGDWEDRALANAVRDSIRDLRAMVDAIQFRATGAAAPSQAAELADMEERKDAAYLERNQVVAALAKCFPSGVARTAIEGWSEDWHGCVYIDLPTGQVSWHFHDSQEYLFAELPPYTRAWDGHDTPEKYRRLAALAAPAAPQGVEAEMPDDLYVVLRDISNEYRHAMGAELDEWLSSAHARLATLYRSKAHRALQAVQDDLDTTAGEGSEVRDISPETCALVRAALAREQAGGAV